MDKRKIIVIFLVFCWFCLFPLKPIIPQEDHHKKNLDEKIFFFEKQVLAVNDFKAEGFILDIGGGGEGVIGQMKEQQVVAIDLSKRELEEAPGNPLKIIMDARDLKFLDDTFKTVTVFFTFMYINPNDHKRVLGEIYRVMVPGGKLLIWDVIFPERKDKGKEIAVFPFSFKLPDREINTGYGSKWPDKGLGLSHYMELAKETKFKVITKKTENRWFCLELKK